MVVRVILRYFEGIENVEKEKSYISALKPFGK